MIPNDLRRSLRDYLKFWRQQRGLSQRGLSKESGVERSFIARLESGEYEKGDPEKIAKLGKALDVSPEGFALLNRFRLTFDQASTICAPNDPITLPPFESPVHLMEAEIQKMVLSPDPDLRRAVLTALTIQNQATAISARKQIDQCKSRVQELLQALADEENLETRQILADLVMRFTELMVGTNEEGMIMASYATDFHSHLKIQQVIQEACRRTGADYAELVTVEDNELKIIYSGSSASSQSFVPDHRQRYDIAEGVTGYAARKGQPVLVGNVENYKEIYLQRRQETCSELAVPIKNQYGKVVAVLNLEHHNEGHFRQTHLTEIENLLKVSKDTLYYGMKRPPEM